MDSEFYFEKELIRYLESIGGTKQWQYMPDINNLDGLWRNFRTILERNNVESLNGVTHQRHGVFQVKSVIRNLDLPYGAGHWKYGINACPRLKLIEMSCGERPTGVHASGKYPETESCLVRA